MNVSKLIILAMALSLPVGIAYADAPDGTISPDEITMDVVPQGGPLSIMRDQEESKVAFARPAGKLDPIEVDNDPDPVDVSVDPEPVKKVCKRRGS